MTGRSPYRIALLGAFLMILLACPRVSYGKDEPELYKVEGNVSALPSAGFVGNWTIGAKLVVVSASTKIEQEAGPLAMGACAEAEGNLNTAGALLAVKLESTISTECNAPGGGGGGTLPGGSPVDEVKLLGAVAELPPAGLIGTWRVGTRVVTVSSATVIEQNVGPVRLNSCVEVEGTPTADSSINARKIEVRASTGGCGFASGDDNGGGSGSGSGSGSGASGSGGSGSGSGSGSGGTVAEVKHIGVLQELPEQGFIGAWLVGGRTVGVNSQTRINQEDGSVRIGACLEAEGTLLSDGQLMATKVSVELGSKCGFVQTPGGGAQSLSSFYGLVESMPPGGGAGTWLVGGRTVLASADTDFDAVEGPLAPGACVEVKGTLDNFGVLNAIEIDTEPPSDCASQGAPGQGFFEIHGLIEQLPLNGVLGDWKVAGRTVRVFPSTVIDTEHGAAMIGSCVEVKGAAAMNGLFDASFIEIRSSAAVCLSRKGVVSAASFTGTTVSPGKIVSLFGIGLGPENPATPNSDDLLRTRRFPTSLGGVRVLFDDSPAPLVFTSRGQINAVVPFSVKGKTEVEVQVEHNGIWSPVVKLPVSTTAPGLFTKDQSGKGPGAILNFVDGNYVVNASGKPAKRGGIVLLYVTGEGEMEREFEDGEIVSSSKLSRPKAEVKVFIGGKQARIEYAGSAPDLIAGLAQLNVVVPEDSPTGDRIKVEVEIGGRRGQDDVTMAIAP